MSEYELVFEQNKVDFAAIISDFTTNGRALKQKKSDVVAAAKRFIYFIEIIVNSFLIRLSNLIGR